jgi:hypothetical protein
MNAFTTLAPVLGALAFAAHAAGPVPAGTFGKISVEYRFESKGEKSGKDSWAQWKIERSAALSAEVTAQKPTPYATLVAPDAARAQAQQHKMQQAEATTQQMQPMMASAENIIAACKGNEACIEREVQKMALGMSGGEVARARATGEQVKSLTAQGPAQVQLWRPKSQSGHYAIVEDVKRQYADPFCTGKPGMRCRRSEARAGQGAIPDSPRDGAATVAMAEVDHAKNTLTIQLPVWLNALPVEQTVASDYPTDKDIGKRSVPSSWRVTDQKPITVPLAASGEQVREVVDASGFPGKLTVRWTFAGGR